MVAILVSIFPEYWKQIKAGKKTWEYRRIVPIQNVDKICYCLSGSGGQIVGIADVDRTIIGDPLDVRGELQNEEGSAMDSFDDSVLLSPRPIAAFHLAYVNSVFEGQNGIKVEKVPQSFKYLDSEFIQKVNSRIIISAIEYNKNIVIELCVQ
jgi:hypothetical protein